MFDKLAPTRHVGQFHCVLNHDSSGFITDCSSKEESTHSPRLRFNETKQSSKRVHQKVHILFTTLCDGSLIGIVSLRASKKLHFWTLSPITFFP